MGSSASQQKEPRTNSEPQLRIAAIGQIPVRRTISALSAQSVTIPVESWNKTFDLDDPLNNLPEEEYDNGQLGITV